MNYTVSIGAEANIVHLAKPFIDWINRLHLKGGSVIQTSRDLRKLFALPLVTDHRHMSAIYLVFVQI